MDNLIFSLKNIEKKFPHALFKNSNPILQNLDFSIFPGETVGLMGKSGSGKTTLVRILLKLLPPDSGSIFAYGKDITHTPAKKLHSFRQQTQMIFQKPEQAFDPSITMKKALLFPLKNLKIISQSPDHCLALMDQMKLKKELLSRYPHQLSGGELQRFSIIRALLLQPRVLILDECTSMLDISVQAQILDLLQEYKKRENLTYILISHDLSLLRHMSTRICELKNGRLTDLQ